MKWKNFGSDGGRASSHLLDPPLLKTITLLMISGLWKHEEQQTYIYTLIQVYRI